MNPFRPLSICVISLLAMATACGTGDHGTTVTIVRNTDSTKSNAWYTNNRLPLVPLHFYKLPVGSIRPSGWLGKNLQLQADGLTGKLGEISPWLRKDSSAWMRADGMGSYGWEELPYWLKGYANL